MLKYYLDKTGKVIKSILFPSSEFVDTEPREGSLNPVTSGGVAGSVAQQSSNIAPNYTKKTYEANSYVMQGGVLYTNPNAIATAEDWNPAHWNEANIAEALHTIDSGTATYESNTLTIPQGKFVDASSVSLGASVTLVFANTESVTLPWWWFRVATTADVTLSVPSGYGFMGETLTTLEANKTYEFVVIANKISWAVSA